MTNSFDTLKNIAFFFATIMLFKYFLFLLIAPFYTLKNYIRKMKTKDGDLAQWYPFVSIIVPAWNEEVGIAKSITSLIRNTYRYIEIIVVNDGSTDRTEEVVATFTDPRILYISKQNGGKGSALNEGVKNASGEIIVSMDADSAFDKNAICNLVTYFRDPSVDAVVGNVKVANGAGIIGLIQQLEYQFGFYFKRAHDILGAEYIFGGACAAFRKSNTFDVYGGFDTQNKTEDIEMTMRLRFNGIKCAFAEDVKAYTEGASSIMGLVNQRLRWKKGRLDTFSKYRSMFFSLKKQHNFFLSWVILPFSLLSELQLLFEPIALTLLVAYSYISGDYLSLALGSAFVFAIYLVNALFGEKPRISLLFMFFVTWPLFYFLVWIEYLALIKSVLLVIRGNDIQWQNWKRVGVEL